MVSEITHKQTKIALKSLQSAVHKELLKKAKLGQDAVVWRDGKICKIKATDLI